MISVPGPPALLRLLREAAHAEDDAAAVRWCSIARAQLRRDEFVLTERKKQLEEAIEDCEDQLETVATIRRRARLTYRRKESDDPLGPVETLRA